MGETCGNTSIINALTLATLVTENTPGEGSCSRLSWYVPFSQLLWPPAADWGGQGCAALAALVKPLRCHSCHGQSWGVGTSIWPQQKQGSPRSWRWTSYLRPSLMRSRSSKSKFVLGTLPLRFPPRPPISQRPVIDKQQRNIAQPSLRVPGAIFLALKSRRSRSASWFS